MTVGELTVRATIWIALLAYVSGPLAALLKDAEPRVLRRLRAIWTVGCVAYLAHSISAFGVYYQWSHAVALEATARDTADVVGRETGTGLYLNYLMGLVWLADVTWWWRNPQGYRDRSPAVTWTVHAFFYFMVFNGTVVFGQGPVRWLGVAISLLLAASLVTSRRWRTVAS